MNGHIGKRGALLAASAILALTTTGCESEGTQAATRAVPVEVRVSRVDAAQAAVTDEVPGRVVAYRVAEIRPQIGGIVRQRLFEQGTEVSAGQPLFQIDSATLRADADTAAATLVRADAALRHAEVQADRLRALVDADAVSRQSYDDAVAARAQATADRAQAQATLRRRRLDIGYATVTAPIAGRIDQALVTEGALVGSGDTTALAIVQQIDRVYVDVRQPAGRIELLRTVGAAPVHIVSATGAPYAVKGRLLFSGISIDPGTGDAIVRIVVPNPNHILLPGMFVRARLPLAAQPEALTVPQQAVSRDEAGNAFANVVDSQGRVHHRPIHVGDVINGRYIVINGLHAGEHVIVEGADRVQPGTPVKALLWQVAASTGSGR